MSKTAKSLRTAAMAMIDLPQTGEVPVWVHLLPAAQGEVRTFDGRGPYHVKDAEAVIAASLGADPRNASGIPIDENHALEIAAKQGGPSPSRGRITEMQARADGIWGKVDWSPSGHALLAERAYRGISPVIIHDAEGVIHQIKNAALVNYPNLRGQVALNQETEMTFQEQLAQLRGLPATATEAEILASIPNKTAEVAFQAQMSEIGTALGVSDGNATAILAAAKAKVTAAPADMVAMQTELTKVSTDFAALQSETRREKATTFVDAAIVAARPGVKPRRDYWITRHMEDQVETEATLNALPSFGPTREGSTAKKVAVGGVADLTGLNAEHQGRVLHDRAVAYQSEQKVKGLTVSLFDAITHVKEEGPAVIPTLIRAFEASAAIAAYTIVKFSDVSASAKIAAAGVNTDPVLGATGAIGAVNIGDMVDVTLSGIGLVTAGGTVTAGALLTTDASGKAIVAVPTAGILMSIIGRAIEPAVANDVFQYLVIPAGFYRGT